MKTQIKREVLEELVKKGWFEKRELDRVELGVMKAINLTFQRTLKMVFKSIDEEEKIFHLVVGGKRWKELKCKWLSDSK